MKELVNLNSLCNFQLSGINNKGNIGNQKLRNCWVAKTLMSSFILFKVWSFSKRNFSEFIRCVGLKCSDSDLKGKGQGERERKLSLSRVMIVRSSYVPLFASLFSSPLPPPPNKIPRGALPARAYHLKIYY